MIEPKTKPKSARLTIDDVTPQSIAQLLGVTSKQCIALLVVSDDGGSPNGAGQLIIGGSDITANHPSIRPGAPYNMTSGQPTNIFLEDVYVLAASGSFDFFIWYWV